MQKVKSCHNLIYPSEKVKRLMQIPNGELPWSKGPMVLTAVPGMKQEPEYVCQILNFDYDAQNNQGIVDVILAADLEKGSDEPLQWIRMSGILIDTQEEKVVGELKPVETQNQSICEMRDSFSLDEPVDNPENLALLDLAGWAFCAH